MLAFTLAADHSVALELCLTLLFDYDP